MSDLLKPIRELYFSEVSTLKFVYDIGVRNALTQMTDSVKLGIAFIGALVINVNADDPSSKPHWPLP